VLTPFGLTWRRRVQFHPEHDKCLHSRRHGNLKFHFVFLDCGAQLFLARRPSKYWRALVTFKPLSVKLTIWQRRAFVCEEDGGVAKQPYNEGLHYSCLQPVTQASLGEVNKNSRGHFNLQHAKRARALHRKTASIQTMNVTFTCCALSIVSRTTVPQSLPNRVLNRLRSSASFINFQYLLA
jgi:hypothetical protein